MAAVPPTAALTAAQWRADLKFMMENLPKVHKDLYHSTSKATFDSAATALYTQIPQLSRDEIIMGMMRIVALAGDGHTNIYPTRDRAIGFHSLPIAMYFFKDGLYIRAAEIGEARIVGARVLKIGSATAQQAYDRVRPYIGRDNEMDALFFAPQLLAMPEVLHALGLSASADSAQFEVEVGGARRSVWLRAGAQVTPRPGDTDDTWRAGSGWIDARDAATTPTPLWLKQSPDTVLWWFAQIPGQRAGYVQINRVRDGDNATLEQFSDRLMAFIDTAQIDRLVIDLRLNRGGNGELRLPLVRALLRTPKINTRGKLFVLIGRSTFSAAQFLLDDLQEYSMALFVGEPSGSKGNTYGDSRQIKLPNSGITVRASVYYWQDWSPFVTRQWTAPDVAAEMSFADY
ncbi:MAG TPA: S41 family peptidase, partial [Gemmatimonadaceae bacterium]|nr:S41 family peptidase [Gemmatimonadaceae bacterium]